MSNTFYLNGQTISDNYSNGSTSVEFDKDIVSKEIHIDFLISNSMTIDLLDLASLYLIVSDIFYHNFTGIRLVVGDIKEVESQVLTRANKSQVIDNLDLDNSRLSIYIGFGSTCSNGLHGFYESKLVASDQFLFNPILLVHEIGHHLGLEDIGISNNRQLDEDSLMVGSSVVFASISFSVRQVYNMHNHRITGGYPYIPIYLLNDSSRENIKCKLAFLYLNSINGNCNQSSDVVTSNMIIDAEQFLILLQNVNLYDCANNVANCEFEVIQSLTDNRGVFYQSFLESQLETILSNSFTQLSPKYNYLSNVLSKDEKNLCKLDNHIEKNYLKKRKKNLERYLKEKTVFAKNILQKKKSGYAHGLRNYKCN